MDKRNRQGWDNVMAKVKQSATSDDRGRKITRQSSRIHNVSKALRNVSDDAKTEAKLNRLNALEADNYAEEHLEEDDEEYVASEDDEEDEDEDEENEKKASRRGKTRNKSQKKKQPKKRKVNSNKAKIVGSDIVASFRTRPLMTWIYEETGKDNYSYYQMLEETKQARKNTKDTKYAAFYSNDRLESIIPTLCNLKDSSSSDTNNKRLSSSEVMKRGDHHVNENQLKVREMLRKDVNNDILSILTRKSDYWTAAAPPSRYPHRQFCSVCGLNCMSSCRRCGLRVCCVKCNNHHKETRCLKFI